MLKFSTDANVTHAMYGKSRSPAARETREK
jgi:hypothetical protein